MFYSLVQQTEQQKWTSLPSQRLLTMGNILRKQKPQEEEFTCHICATEMPSTKRFKNNTLCSHPYCHDCIAKFIEANVANGAATIKCPALDCYHRLDPVSCRPFIPNKLFRWWCDRLCDSAVLGIDRCYCPYRDCSTLVLNECGGQVKKAACPNCKREFCFQCRVPWHAGYWCSESRQRRSRDDVLFGMLVEWKKWIRCYKCGHAIEKNGGCAQLTCRCGTTLCYKCGHANRPRKSCDGHPIPLAVFMIFFSLILFLTVVMVFISLFLMGKITF